ncbi:response regulator transcription factor [Amylibacter sp. SFDW26]|uniref:response regulator transcription factor n=1 Tax=Amylibacter sp. SFDW26 TaxID=2652722 RepID=UPI001262AA8E|nr:response regulator [Amylibacter sp. SFDW26]KAB7613781.1 response regulator transcription factor [Amylibacter sp. SFDW26]
MSEANLTVFLVDDDEDIRSSLSRALTKRGFHIENFASAEEFLDTYNGEKSGCLLLDYGMPRMNGLELQQHMISKGYSLPIIFITGHGGIPESVQAMKAGAIDFLEKPFRQKTLVDCINAAFETALATQEHEKKTKDLRIKFERLTDREKEIAQLMVSNSSSTSSKDIGRILNISPRTVDHHRARILDKMNINSVTELVDLSIRANLFSK